MKMTKVVNLRQYLEMILPFCQRNLYEGAETKLTNGQIPLLFNGACSSLFSQNIIHQWWQSTVTAFEQPVFGVRNLSVQDLDDVCKSCLSNYSTTSQFVNERLPFGLAQVSSCRFHHQMFTPRSSMTCMVFQFFVPPASAISWFDHIQRHRSSWWKKFSGTPTNFSKVNLSCQDGEQVVELQYKFPWGSEQTIERISHRDTQLNSQCNLKGKDGRKSVIPHMIECVTFDEVAMLTYLTEALRERSTPKGATKLKLHLHRFLAPYKVSITQSNSSDIQLKELASYLNKELRKMGLSVLYPSDTSLSVEQQFQKCDEMGIPYCLVLTDGALTNGILGLRNRDTTLQEQVHVAEAAKLVKRYVTSIFDSNTTEKNTLEK